MENKSLEGGNPKMTLPVEQKLPFLGWIHGVNQDNNSWHIRDFDIKIAELIDAAIDGRVSKILLSVPSRHGKSTLISKYLASYFLSYYPNDHVILSAYSQSLASQFGGQVKDIINYYGESLSPYHVRLSTDSHAKNKFNLAGYDGQMIAVGANGSLMGFGAGLFIVDDPIKNVADADSETKQNNLREWFNGVVRSRLEKRTNGRPPIIIVIAQRLHLKDLHGIIKESSPYIDGMEAFNILDNGGTIPFNTWVDLNIPAICTDPTNDILGRKPGEVLWPYQRDYEWLMNEKKEIGSYLFNAIYQGRPQERDGNIFRREWFMNTDTNEIYRQLGPDEYPYDLPHMRYWDFGASGKKGDATSGALTGWDGTNLYIQNINSGKYTASQVLNTFETTALKDGTSVKIRIEQEPGAGSKLLINQFRRNPTFKHYNIRGDKVKLKKNVRSFNLEALAEAGRIYWLGGEWNIDIIDHLVSFTGQDGKPDDITDSLTGSCNIWRRPKRKINV